MLYPKNWFSLELDGALVTFSPERDSAAHAPRFNVVVQDLTGLDNGEPFSLEKFTNDSLYLVQQGLPEVEILLADRPLGGYPGKHVEYATSIDGNMYKFTQVFALKENNAYIVSFAGPEPLHVAYSEIVGQCIDSFRFKKDVSSVSLLPYINQTHAYKLWLPVTWKFEELQGGAVVKFEFADGAGTTITLLVSAQTVDSRIDLSTYAELLDNQISECTTEKSKPEQAVLGGYPAKRLKFFSDSLQITGHYFQVWTLLKTERRALHLSFINTLPEDDLNKDDFLAMFSRIAETLEFSTAEDELDSFLRYENLAQKFAIYYPKTFEPQEGITGAVVSFLSTEPSTFTTTFNVSLPEFDYQLTLEDYSEHFLRSLNEATQMRDCHIQYITDISVAGAKGREFVYTAKIAGATEGLILDLKFLQRAILMGEKMVLLNFAGEVEKFDQELENVSRCLSSFSLFNLLN